MHSAKCIHFAECWTRILGKEYNLCRVSLHQHSAKSIHFAECFSQARGKYPSPFFSSVTSIFFTESRIRRSAKSLLSARQKTFGKEAFADTFFAVSSLPSVTLGKIFAERLCYFAECLKHSAK
jgi:hypothetical protein